MSLRSKLKVPKYGLFYFESDHTLSMLPSTKETVFFVTLIPSKFLTHGQLGTY